MFMNICKNSEICGDEDEEECFPVAKIGNKEQI
jgi:hypothetical protein